MPVARDDLLVIGTGNLLREDDAVGIVLVRALRNYYGPTLSCEETYELDIILAERIAGFASVLVVDAKAPVDKEAATNASFTLSALEAADSLVPNGGFISHVVDWGVLLAMSRHLYGSCPEASLLAVRAEHLGLCEGLSPGCRGHAEVAFAHLIRLCAKEGNVVDENVIPPPLTAESSRALDAALREVFPAMPTGYD